MEQAEAIQPTDEQVVDDVLGSSDGMSGKSNSIKSSIWYIS